MDEGIKRLIIAETELVQTAELALEAKTSRNMRKYTKLLLKVSKTHVEIVNDPAGGYDYQLLATEILTFALTDLRLIMDVPPEQIDPNSRLSQRLETRRERWPVVSDYLETLIHRASV